MYIDTVFKSPAQSIKYYSHCLQDIVHTSCLWIYREFTFNSSRKFTSDHTQHNEWMKAICRWIICWVIVRNWKTSAVWTLSQLLQHFLSIRTPHPMNVASVSRPIKYCAVVGIGYARFSSQTAFTRSRLAFFACHGKPVFLTPSRLKLALMLVKVYSRATRQQKATPAQQSITIIYRRPIPSKLITLKPICQTNGKKRVR